MKLQDSLRWFKTTFHAKLQSAVAGTPFTVDLLTAIAQQETGYIWATLVKKGLPLNDILRLCTSDTIDARIVNGKNKGRRAFPKNKADLLTHPKGAEMFQIAREALLAMAEHIRGFESAVANPAKFCRGFGIFQYDLQHLKVTPEYFLEKKWHSFDVCLERVVAELHAAQKRMGWQSKKTLTHDELVHVAIAYNKGKSVLSKGFKQGHKSGGRYYGENIHEYLLLAKRITVDGSPAPVVAANEAPLPQPEPVSASGAVYRVNVNSHLNLRSGPGTQHSVVKKLPAGQLVRRLDGNQPAAWLKVETFINTARFEGYVASEWLKKVPAPSIPAEATPNLAPVTPIPAFCPPSVLAPRNPGTITRRRDPAGARSLNEEGQPSRTGETAVERVASITKIMDWLDVAESTHTRYQPGNGKTFCNIYAHDFCHLAGVYLPRVWWRPPAIARMAQGQTVEPLLGTSIDEQRANDLCRWLNDFGSCFGWKETNSLTELQEAANLGAVCLIVARRKVEGASGHIAMVVPETDEVKASRNAAGAVTNPVQSQAGSVNFKRRKGTSEWYKQQKFEEYGFWMHA